MIPLSSFLLSLLWSCDDAKQMATVAVPILEDSNPSWARPVDCDEKRAPILSDSSTAFTQSFLCDVNQRAPFTIEGTTIKGQNLLHDDFFQQAKCTPARTHFYRNSPEAMYQLKMAPNTMAEIRLDTNCTDLDPFAFSWDRRSPPTSKHASGIRECEMNTYDGDGTFKITTVDRPQTYILGVVGKDGMAGNFRLTIKCRSYR